jgi:CelD/BcsL family acetyltransferase involved in cellulose biosynthesis
MALGRDWETFYREKRSSSTRRHARAKLKNLGEIGPVAFATASAADDVRGVLGTLFQQKAASFARMGAANFLNRPGYRDFYQAVASADEYSALVHVSKFSVGETLSAANLGMVFRGRYYHVLASHGGGAAIERFGPGTAHLHMLIEHAIQAGCHTFDFTIGDESYKQDWCEQQVSLWDLCHASSARGVIVSSVWFASLGLKRFIKQRAPLWAFYKRARRAVAFMNPGVRADRTAGSSDGG